MSLTCFSLRDGDGISDSQTCLVNMKTIEEEEEEEEEDYEKINIEQIEKSLHRRRQIKLACISLGFLLSVGLVIYSVLVDVNNQNSKFKIGQKMMMFDLNDGFSAQICQCWKKLSVLRVMTIASLFCVQCR